MFRWWVVYWYRRLSTMIVEKTVLDIYLIRCFTTGSMCPTTSSFALDENPIIVVNDALEEKSGIRRVYTLPT
jgi:hypothetical protein